MGRSRAYVIVTSSFFPAFRRTMAGIYDRRRWRSGCLTESMDTPHRRHRDRNGNPGYVFCVALAVTLALSTACGSASAVESMSAFRDIMVKGTKVGKEVQEHLRRNNPDAAMVVTSRHMREVDDTIKKVERDPVINNRNKVELLKQLRGYRADLAQSRNALREMSDLMVRFGNR